MAFRFVPTVFLSLAVLLPLGNPAAADSIDGNWCSADSQKMTIDGPRIVTPAGASLTGQYDRHAFKYVIPANEPSPGATVEMVLVDEDTVNLNLRAPDGAEGPLEVWFRCKLTT